MSEFTDLLLRLWLIGKFALAAAIVLVVAIYLWIAFRSGRDHV